MNQQTQPGQTAPQPTESSGGSLKWLLIVLVIVIVGAGAYWWFGIK